MKFNISQFANIWRRATSFPVPIVYVIYRRKCIVDENGYDNEDEKEEEEDEEEDDDDGGGGSGGLVLNNQTCT